MERERDQDDDVGWPPTQPPHTRQLVPLGLRSQKLRLHLYA